MKIQDSQLVPESRETNAKISNVHLPVAENLAEAVRFSPDETDLSAGGTQVQQLKTQLAGLPDVRQDRVQQLQQAVRDGTYKVDDGRVADAMLADWSAHAEGEE